MTVSNKVNCDEQFSPTSRPLPFFHHEERFDKLCCYSACLDPFGIAEGVIPNKAMTSSSVLGPGFEPFHGRLNSMSGSGSWCSTNLDQEAYLQIDLGDRFQVTMLGIQGNALHKWIVEKKIRVSCR